MSELMLRYSKLCILSHSSWCW